MVTTKGTALNGDDCRRDLIATLADWSWECDATGRIDFLSPEFEATTGLWPQSLLGQLLRELASADVGSVLPGDQRGAIAAEKPFRDLVVKLERADGGVVWIEIAGAPKLQAGNFRGYCGIGRTMTARAEDVLALQRYRQLFEVASDWFWETDTENRLTYISPNVETMLGLPVSSYIGKRLVDIEGVIIEPEAARASRATVRSRQPYRDLLYLRKLPDGKTVWINSSGAPFFGTDGAFLGYRGIARDVTAQVEAEHALRSSEQRFRQMFELGSDFYWEVDAETRYVFVSPGWELLHDCSFDEVRGKHHAELPGVSATPEMARLAFASVKNRQPFRDFVYSRKLSSGETRWFSNSGMPIFDRDGEFRGFQGAGTDVTARIKAEVVAGLAQQRLHDAVNFVSQPLIVYDAEDLAIAYNRAFSDIHRADGKFAELLDLSFSELTRWQVKTGLYQTGADQPPIDFDTLHARHLTEDEHTYRLGDGRWMLVTYRQLPGGGRVGLWTDITAIKRAEAERLALEAQLHHSQRLEALGTLAGGAAHEINNALMPLLALGRLVAPKLPEGSRERRHLDTAVIGARHVRDLVAQILAFARREDETGQAQSNVDLGVVLQQALSLMRATVPTNIRFEEEIAPTPAITGDPTQLHQVIVNVVANAAHAIGRTPGSIKVSLRPEADGAQLRLSVADTGCGMNEAALARVFEPFFTTKPVGEGTGLGLSVVHGIVKAHGGRIEARSKLGQGSRFDVFLPVPPATSGS
jgi:PAS domain S-box-containing protein